MVFKNVLVSGIFIWLSCTKIQAQISTVDSIGKNYDFSNKKQIDLTGLTLVYSSIKKSTIVVLNKKEIVTIDSKKFSSLTNDMILSIDIIDDRKATTEIKTIIFVQTK